MKHLLFIVLIICSSSFSLQAQSDSSKTKQSSSGQPNNKQAIPQEERSHPTKNMVRVHSKDIPEGLKKTLAKAQYLGWEKGALYFDKKTKEYALLMPSGASYSDSLKDNREIMGKKAPSHTGWYYFTYDGTPISG